MDQKREIVISVWFFPFKKKNQHLSSSLIIFLFSNNKYFFEDDIVIFFIVQIIGMTNSPFNSDDRNIFASLYHSKCFSFLDLDKKGRLTFLSNFI